MPQEKWAFHLMRKVRKCLHVTILFISFTYSGRPSPWSPNHCLHITIIETNHYFPLSSRDWKGTKTPILLKPRAIGVEVQFYFVWIVAALHYLNRVSNILHFNSQDRTETEIHTIREPMIQSPNLMSFCQITLIAIIWAHKYTLWSSVK